MSLTYRDIHQISPEVIGWVCLSFVSTQNTVGGEHVDLEAGIDVPGGTQAGGEHVGLEPFPASLLWHHRI